VKGWLARWRDIFRGLEYEGHWELQDPVDNAVLLYVYMPIVRRELEMQRRQYNSYPMRKNTLSRLPSGPPEDNYKLRNPNINFSVAIDPAWVPLLRASSLGDFNADEYLHSETTVVLDRLLFQSPLGAAVDVTNARDQYLYLRNCLGRG
jgi:hypothetical protein